MDDETAEAEKVLRDAGWFDRTDIEPYTIRGILHRLADAGLLR